MTLINPGKYPGGGGLAWRLDMENDTLGAAHIHPDLSVGSLASVSGPLPRAGPGVRARG